MLIAFMKASFLAFPDHVTEKFQKLRELRQEIWHKLNQLIWILLFSLF